MRLAKLAIITAAVSALLLAPVAALANGPTYRGNRGDCRRMTKQINHYENVVLKQARARGDKLWEASMSAHLDKLKNRRADRCPNYGAQRSAARRAAAEMRALMSMAAKGAAKYFTGGWL